MTMASRQPTSCFDLFCSCTLIALQGFGGVLAIVQRELVDKKGWLTQEEFVEEWAVAQVMPGPNVVNLTLMIGARYFGLRGALSAMAGMLLLPMLIALLVGIVYRSLDGHPGVAGAMRGMGAVAAGLIIATGLKMFAALKSNPLGKTTCVLFGMSSFVCIALLHVPLFLLLIFLGPVACYLAWRALPAA